MAGEWQHARPARPRQSAQPGGDEAAVAVGGPPRPYRRGQPPGRHGALAHEAMLAQKSRIARRARARLARARSRTTSSTTGWAESARICRIR